MRITREKQKPASVFWVVAAYAVMLAACAGDVRADAVTPEAVPPAAADAPSDTTATALAPREEDYYTRRAKNVIANEAKHNIVVPHPLAAAHPGQTVVVCEAGCPRGKAEIVFMKPNVAAKTVVSAAMEQTSARSLNAPVPTSASTSVIECMGGCYDTPKFYSAPRQPAAMKTADTALKPRQPAVPRKHEPFSPVR